MVGSVARAPAAGEPDASVHVDRGAQLAVKRIRRPRKTAGRRAMPGGRSSSTARSRAAEDVCDNPDGNPGVHENGDFGIDNSFGANILQPLAVLRPSFSQDINDFITDGNFTLMVKVKGLTGPGQTATAVPAASYAGGRFSDDPARKPTFTLADDWPVLAEGGNITPLATFDDGYVVDGLWVSQADSARLSMTLFGVPLSIQFRRAILSFRYDGAATPPAGRSPASSPGTSSSPSWGRSRATSRPRSAATASRASRRWSAARWTSWRTGATRRARPATDSRAPSSSRPRASACPSRPRRRPRRARTLASPQAAEARDRQRVARPRATRGDVRRGPGAEPRGRQQTSLARCFRCSLGVSPVQRLNARRNARGSGNPGGRPPRRPASRRSPDGERPARGLIEQLVEARRVLSQAPLQGAELMWSLSAIVSMSGVPFIRSR